jgi:hypothetical protein
MLRELKLHISNMENHTLHVDLYNDYANFPIAKSSQIFETTAESSMV